MKPIFRATPEEMKQELLAFNGIMPKVRSHDSLLVPTGQKTMGGTRDAEGYLDRGLAAVFVPPTNNMREVVTGAIRLARTIVGGHVFHDGNGRTCLYAIYFWCANWGVKVTIRPIALHALILGGEDQRDHIPDDCAEPLIALAVPAEQQSLSSFLLKKKRQLSALQDRRRDINEHGRQMSYDTKLLGRRGKSGVYSRVQLWKRCRSAGSIPASAPRGSERDIAVRTFMSLAGGFHATPDGVRLVNMWMQQIEDDLGHVPSADEVVNWMRWNWVD